MGTFQFNPKFILKDGVHGRGIFTTVKFTKGETLFEMSGEIKDKPTRTSIQIGENEHIEDDIGVNINHNCTPNAKVNRKNHTFVALQDIEADEEITFDYNQNEDSMAAPFVCHCCNKEIAGKKTSKIKAVG